MGFELCGQDLSLVRRDPFTQSRHADTQIIIRQLGCKPTCQSMRIVSLRNSSFGFSSIGRFLCCSKCHQSNGLKPRNAQLYGRTTSRIYRAGWWAQKKSGKFHINFTLCEPVHRTRRRTVPKLGHGNDVFGNEYGVGSVGKVSGIGADVVHELFYQVPGARETLRPIIRFITASRLGVST